MLKDIALSVNRSAVILNPNNPAASGFLGVIEAVGPSVGIQAVPIALRDSSDSERAALERVVEGFAQRPNGGMIALPDFTTITLRQPIVAMAARHRLPAIYPFRYFITVGGLVSYGVDQVEQSRLAAGYVDRLLKGENPAELPVQQPTKFQLVINLQVAKALSLTVPHTLLARADEVIE